MKSMNKWQATPRDLYQEVTDRIIAALEAGTRPWERGWQMIGGSGPMNPTTGRLYRGINTLLLGLGQMTLGSNDPRWCSYRQAQARGWQVRKGERGTTVVFYRQLQRRDEDGSDHGDQTTREGVSSRPLSFLRASTVFHASQIDGIATFTPRAPGSFAWECPDAVDVILNNSHADIRYGGDQAFFMAATDHIQLPACAQFHDAGSFAQTALHELGHYLCAKPRLDLREGGRFGSTSYAHEELVVEIASQNVCATIGVDAHLDNSASYVAGWIEELRQDRKAIFRAASAAQRVADAILGFHPDYADSHADLPAVPPNTHADWQAVSDEIAEFDEAA